MTKKIKIVTHSSGFHTDDVFAVATLLLLLGDENCEVIRSRDKEVIESADYVVDVGFVHNPERNRFDHHQEGKAGERDNGIPYASFGLVWKKFGVDVVGSRTLADAIDQWLVQPIDAFDNGVDLAKLARIDVRPFLIQNVVEAFHPGWRENRDMREAFSDAVMWAKVVLQREIVYQNTVLEMQAYAEETYQQSKDKRLIIFEGKRELSRDIVIGALLKHSEPLYFMRYRGSDGNWSVECVRNDVFNFDTNRKPLPREWAGKNKEELATVTGVSDAYFCHNNCFLCVARSREGAFKLAQLALEV
ncbi:MYG1 family protein [Candidatus Wolfebacteria bacterium]|nr:MYG1 family protein [Candidatus Wolfebacteria bacterium]